MKRRSPPSDSFRPWEIRRQFDRIWRRLALIGVCDSLDGQEYHRCYAAWIAQGRPTPINAFIVSLANLPAYPELWQEE